MASEAVLFGDEASYTERAAGDPLERPVSFGEIVDAIVFLALPRSSYHGRRTIAG